MPADINDLIKIKGIIAAGEFSREGELLSYVGDMDIEMAKSISEMCAANMMMARMQAQTFDKLSGMYGFDDSIGFSVSGPKLSVCVVGTIGVFIDSDTADFNEIFRTLRRGARPEKN